MNSSDTLTPPGSALPGRRSSTMSVLFYCSVGVCLNLLTLSTTYAKAALEITLCEYSIADEFVHDRQAFTQGLTSDGSRLFESTGLYGKSGIREVELETGKVLRQRSLDKNLFGEGLTYFDGKLYQITWKSGRGFVYASDHFDVLDTFTIQGEGWGLTHNETHLIMSDGTSTIRFLDPKSYRVDRTIQVTNDGREIPQINELEFINGSIWANIWQAPWIAKINPDTGEVQAWLDLTPIAQQFADIGVANGIVWHAQDEAFIVTGKNWPAMFSIVPDCL